MLDRTELTWILTAAIAAMALTGCGGSDAGRREDSRPAATVRTVAVATEDWPGGLEVSATLQPWLRATPGTVLMGRVEEVRVREGDRVRQGQVLARVDSDDIGARVAQARAAVAAAKAMEQNARVMRERIERLHARQAASTRDLDDVVAGHDAALAQVQAAEEGVKAAEANLAYAEVKAPFDGWVTGRRIEPGDLAAPGMPLFVIDDLSRVKVEGQVPESLGPTLHVGDPVEVVLFGERRAATIGELVPAVDPRSRTWTVRAVLNNRDGTLRSGMFARMTVGGDARPVIAAPESALIRRGSLTGLFVVESLEGRDVARLRWITTGDARDGRVEVLTGLTGDETIVAEPGPRLEDGQPLEVGR